MMPCCPPALLARSAVREMIGNLFYIRKGWRRALA